MATIKMKKGNIVADIFDSPETIKTAENDGYVICKDEPKVETVKPVEKVEESKPRRARK